MAVSPRYLSYVQPFRLWMLSFQKSFLWASRVMFVLFLLKRDLSSPRIWNSYGWKSNACLMAVLSKNQPLHGENKLSLSVATNHAWSLTNQKRSIYLLSLTLIHSPQWIVNRVAENHYFSKIDLKSAYHQIPIKPADRPYTAFEEEGNLCQFSRLDFGVSKNHRWLCKKSWT